MSSTPVERLAFRLLFGLLQKHPLGLQLRTFLEIGLDLINQGLRFRRAYFEGRTSHQVGSRDRITDIAPARAHWWAADTLALAVGGSIPSPPTTARPRHARVSNIWSPAGRSSSGICSDPSHQRG